MTLAPCAIHPARGDRQGADVIIVGGGLQGCSAALHLAGRGVDVLLLERDHVGRHASAANAGGVRRIGRHPAELELSAASARIWERLPDLVGTEAGFQRVGHMFVAETEDELDALRARRAQVQALGHEFEELVSAEEVRAAVPGIGRHVVGGLANWSDGYANPFATVRAFREAALRLGARIETGVRVDAARRLDDGWLLATTGGEYRADRVLNCAGFGGARVAAMFGDEASLSVEAPMMMVTTPVPRYHGPVLGRVKGRMSLKASANGSLLIGGGHRARYSDTARKVTVDFAGIAKSARTLGELMPDLTLGRIQRAWYGLEAYTTDGLPILGPSPSARGLLHAFGFSGHGFQLGPVIGRVLSDLVVDGTTGFDISAFALDRFSRPRPDNPVWCSLGARMAAKDSPGALPIS
ncbi:NAD(P)/FAD-dependent oxidoreductase [Limimaricola pyoseonensis]|uniref:Sarcosine oxidase subunit beta n=1 Tax=Limimaricola pyoseonensis TaxID=521013 RepID=A0A1G7HU34_9RHOB|nr:FAD-dependent oxidoreductase [Limimaricola pyoseonensis]SDF03915.1 sarcosine oxidase subunit beta [Limimaricola pyoseonensis]